MGLSKYAKGSIFGKTEDIEEYKDIYELDLDKKYKFTSFFYNSKAEYPHYVLQYKNIGYSLPTHMNKTFNEIKEDADAIKEIKAGIAYFTVYEYEKEVKIKNKNQKAMKKYRSINIGVMDPEEAKKAVHEDDDEYVNVASDELPFD